MVHCGDPSREKPKVEGKKTNRMHIVYSAAFTLVTRLQNRYTMPAKSLGTLAMIYAIVELQNPLPRKTMLWKGDMNVSASTSDTFLQR